MRRGLIPAAFCSLALGAAAHGQAAYSVAWQIEGRNGFSAANAIVSGSTGQVETIVVCERDVGVVALSSQGARVWEYPLEPPVTAAPAVADIDGDGREDVVAADSRGNLVALDADGGAIWTARTLGGVLASSCPAIADLDGDGRPEVLVGDAAGALSCFDHRGHLRWRFSGDGGRMGPVLVADIYDSGGKEIVVTTHDRHVYALDDGGAWLWDLYAPDDLFPNSTPILADVNGDGTPELYVGGGLHHFYQIDLRQPGFSVIENVYLHINAAISAADIDGDGRDEVLFGNKGGALHCFGEGGMQWVTELRHSSLSAAPLTMNLDDDAALEILAYSAHGDLNIIDTDGTLTYSTSTPVTMHTTPLVGDLDNDGMLEVCGGGKGGYASPDFALADLGVPYQPHPQNRLVYAGDRAHSGQPPGARSYSLLPVPEIGVADPQGASLTGELRLLSGANTWRFDIANPLEKRLVLLTDLADPDGGLQRFANHSRGAMERVAMGAAITTPGSYRVSHRLIDVAASTVLVSREERHRYDGFDDDRGYLERVVGATEAVLDDWGGTNPRRADSARDQALDLREELLQLERLAPAESLDRLGTLRQRAERLQSMVEAGRALASRGSFAAWSYNPWAYFSVDRTVPRPSDRTDSLAAAVCIGEYESLALNLTSFAAHTVDVRVWAEDFRGPGAAPANDHIQLRRAVTVPTLRRHLVADALPTLDRAGLITIPAQQSQQLWITLNARGLAPGVYQGRLHLKSVEPDPTEVLLPIRLTVHDLALPRPRPLRFCQWSYDGGDLGADNPVVLQDLVEHGVTVYFGRAPRATCDEHGGLVQVDYAVTDEQVRRLSPHGLLMFNSPQGALSGAPFLTEPWNTAFIAYLRAWAAHMDELGLGYEDWALYPYDEPSTPYAETTRRLVEVATVIRQADPQILIYTDPTSGTTMESVDMLSGLIDIWCPSAELLERLGPELVPRAREVGKEVWFYDASGRAKGLSCLGLYRWRFWYAWNMGFTGAGWWAYSHHGPDRWEGPNRTGDFFATVYGGPRGPVSSKRWEAAREGIEDYEYLWLLRAAIEDAEIRGPVTPALRDARQLLAGAPRDIQRSLYGVGRRLPLTPDGVPAYDQATRALETTRQRLVEACLSLREK